MMVVEPAKHCRPLSELLTPLVKQRWHAMGLPLFFLVGVTTFLHATGATEPHDLDAIEMFAGCKSWSSELQKSGLRVFSFEINDDAEHCNFLNDRGLLTALGAIWRCKPGATVHWATVCSSWVTVNRFTSGRSVANIYGRADRPYVAQANAMVSRMCLCILVAVALNLDWVLEQPLTSLMKQHPRMQAILGMSGAGAIKLVSEVHTLMGAFGGFSPKPTMLIGTPRWLEDLKRKLPPKAIFMNKQAAESYVDNRGVKRFKGCELQSCIITSGVSKSEVTSTLRWCVPGKCAYSFGFALNVIR